VDWCPPKEVPCVVEGGKESHAKPAVSHGVQETVAGGREKQINPQRQATNVGRALGKRQNQNSSGEKSSERKRVCKSAVPPEIVITDTEPETNDIEIWNHGA
jgi:hypothetical protein